jgi:hypothetical protein
MEKPQFSEVNYYEWWDNKGKSHWAPRNEQPRKKSGEEEKEAQKKMIRSLQGIFCMGRYRSWLAAQR